MRISTEARRVSRPGFRGQAATLGWRVLVPALACVLAGCKPKGELALEAAPPNAPSARQIIASHNERVAKLTTTYSRGVIEVRWRDDRGKHQHQGDLDFYRSTDDRTALSITKVGERLLWLGSNEQEYWLFDLTDKTDRVLYRGRNDEPLTAEGSSAALQAFGIRPQDLLDLLALRMIDETAIADEPPAYDRKRKAYVLVAENMRLSVDRSTLLPVRVELLDATGKVVAESTHARYETVEMPGVAPLARPKMAELIDIRQGESLSNAETGITGEIKIAINDTTTVVDQKQLQRVFDLDTLIKSLQPDRVALATQTD